jgi:hypothetical protein
MLLKVLMRGTTFLVEPSSDLKWILNENSEKLEGMNLTRI